MGSKPHNFWVCMAIHVKCASRIAINESTNGEVYMVVKQLRIMHIKLKANHMKPQQ